MLICKLTTFSRMIQQKKVDTNVVTFFCSCTKLAVARYASIDFECTHIKWVFQFKLAWVTHYIWTGSTLCSEKSIIDGVVSWTHFFVRVPAATILAFCGFRIWHIEKNEPIKTATDKSNHWHTLCSEKKRSITMVLPWCNHGITGFYDGVTMGLPGITMVWLWWCDGVKVLWYYI